MKLIMPSLKLPNWKEVKESIYYLIIIPGGILLFCLLVIWLIMKII